MRSHEGRRCIARHPFCSSFGVVGIWQVFRAVVTSFATLPVNELWCPSGSTDSAKLYALSRDSFGQSSPPAKKNA